MFYSISDLARYSGVKAHTIRIWEQRYNILSPHRTETNIRYYDDQQLHKLLNVSSLVRAGHRISKVSKYSQAAIIDAIKELESMVELEDVRYDHSRNTLLAAALKFDEVLFEKTLTQSIEQFGLEETYVQVIGPMLNKTGLMWRQQEMDPSQEHFASCLVRQKLSAAISNIPAEPKNGKLWLLFLPEHEEHEIGLLFAQFLLRKAGKHVIYLGPRVPMSSLVTALDTVQPSYLLTFITASRVADETQAYLDDLADHFSECEIFVAGAPALIKQLRQPKNVVFMESVDALTGRLSSSKVKKSAK